MSNQSPQPQSSLELPPPINDAFLSLHAVLRMIVVEPDQLVLTSEIVSDDVFLRVRSNEKDVGKLIGRQGRVAQALRIVLYAMTDRSKLTVHLDIDKRSVTIQGQE